MRERALGRGPWVSILVLAAIPLSTPARGQAWRGEARVSGVVTDLDDQPIASASVVVRREGEADLGPPATETDADGRWTIRQLAAGRWTITVKARGYLTSSGWFHLPTTGITAVDVALRRLAEVTPRFSESPGTVVRWIEKGNDLLEQGYPEAARAEYERALEVLPPPSRPEVLRAVARTWYLQGETAESARSLEEALTLQPGDPLSRQLYTDLLEQLGRSREAEEFLATLDREGTGTAAGRTEAVDATPPSAAAGVASPSSRQVDELPVEPAVSGRRGRYRTSFRRRSPHGDCDLFLRRAGIERQDLASVDPQAGVYDLAEESFHVFVPETPAPARGYGVLVWISPGPSGGFDRVEVREMLEEHDLIWVGADQAGNRRHRWYRIWLALDAVHNLASLYAIDEERVYAAGYSGGGRIASWLALLYPEVFDGGLSLFGCDYFGRVDMPDKPGAYWPPRFPAPAREVMRQIKTESRFVLLTGELDFNRSQTKATYQQMIADGFEHVSYLSIPGASHYDPVAKAWLKRAIGFLDAPDEALQGNAPPSP